MLSGTGLRLETTSADGTRDAARSVAPLCVPGDVLLLAGDLGAGKTVFAQGFGLGLGITAPITSPTFTLVRQYRVGSAASGPFPNRIDGADRTGGAGGAAGADGAGGAAGADGTDSGGRDRVRTFLHADVYRLDHLREIVDLGLGELVEDGGVALVEWGDAAEPVLGEGSLSISLVTAHDDEDRRLISVRAAGDRWLARWGALRGALAPWAER